MYLIGNKNAGLLAAWDRGEGSCSKIQRAASAAARYSAQSRRPGSMVYLLLVLALFMLLMLVPPVPISPLLFALEPLEIHVGLMPLF